MKQADCSGPPPWVASAGLSPFPLRCPALCQVLYEDCRVVDVRAPYVPGFLAVREGPVLVEAVQRLREQEPSLSPQVRWVPLGGEVSPARAGGALAWSRGTGRGPARSRGASPALGS